jgi:hypothetical protein
VGRFLPAIAVTDEARDRCWKLAERDMGRFAGAANTRELAGAQIDGIYRGRVAEWAASTYLGAEWVSAEADDDPGFDILTPGGRRLDVKAGRRWKPLRIPLSQIYKVDSRRLDGFVLAFYPFTTSSAVELCGWIDVERFLDEYRVDRDLPAPAAVVDPSACEWLPEPAP